MASIEPPGTVMEWTQFIRDVGFPIFVAGYVLIRLERTMQKLTDAITEALQEVGRPRD